MRFLTEARNPSERPADESSGSSGGSFELMVGAGVDGESGDVRQVDCPPLHIPVCLLFRSICCAKQSSAPRDPLQGLGPRESVPFAPEAEAGALSASSSVVQPESRASVQASFPPASRFGAVELSHTLQSDRSSRWRAWLAGCWAGAVLAGQVGVPNATAKIRHPTGSWPCGAQSCVQFCCILCRGRQRHITELQCFARLPSKAEANIFCLAAGVEYPEHG